MVDLVKKNKNFYPTLYRDAILYAMQESSTQSRERERRERPWRITWESLRLIGGGLMILGVATVVFSLGSMVIAALGNDNGIIYYSAWYCKTFLVAMAAVLFALLPLGLSFLLEWWWEGF